ncbi:PAS domain S-box protein [Accumulibacter sp.]|uniref:PAS domain S-box protein n=1 Tax=Accumulibacter sp. TaxID=2053492 RepID=UPI002D1FB894|nr:PAS domain S-box protein [Accumulibacter sp.]
MPRAGLVMMVKLSIRQGLWLFVVLGALTLSSIVGLGMWGTWRGQEGLRQVLEDEVGPTQNLIVVDKELTHLRAQLYGVLNDDMSAAGARLHLETARRDLPRAWALYREATAGEATADEQHLVDTIEAAMLWLPGFAYGLDQLLARRDLAAIATVLKEDWWAVQLQVVIPVRQLIALQEGHVAESYVAAQAVYRKALLGELALFVVGLVLLLTFSRRLLRYVGYKLDVIEGALQRIGQGDFGTRVKGSHRGEFGRILVALDRTADTLRADREAINILRQRQASILESMVEGLYGTDAEGRMNYVNAAAERLLGWTAAEMLGQRPHAMFHHTRADGSPYPAAECPLSGARLRQEPSAASDEVFWRKDGSSFPVDFAGSPIVAGERTVGAVAVFRDISERRTAEHARQKLLAELHQRNEQLTLTEDQLRRKEEELRSVLDNLRDGVITIDEQGLIRSFNPAICSIFQQPPEALYDQSVTMLIPSELRNTHRHGLARHLATGETHVLGKTVELEGLRSDGSRFPIELSINAYSVRGKHFYSGIIRDSTARKEAEKALRNALDQAQEYLDVALAVIVVIDCDLRVRMINRAGCELLRLSESEIVGANWFDRFVPEPQRESLGDSFRCWLAGRPKGVIAAHNQNDLLTADGRIRRVLWSNALLRDSSGTVTGTLSSGIDITDQHAAELQLHASIEHLTELNRKLGEAQNQLLQAEKMASIGQLAAGVAHEINNPVGFVNSNLGSLRDEVSSLLQVIDAYAAADTVIAEHPALRDAIAAAREAADLDYVRDDVGTLIDESLEGLQRVRKIVQDLKDFSRVDTAEWQFANLEAGLDSTLNIVWNEIKYKAAVHKEYAGVPEVECIPAQINQILLNLLVNAAHAIEQRGTITLRTGFDARQVWVEVEDTGKGIAPENLKRIFEPFFTTKPVGQGTGLGLSLAYGIAKRHGGRIEVSSELGSGTRFRLLLPSTRPPAGAAPTAAPTSVAGSGDDQQT